MFPSDEERNTMRTKADSTKDSTKYNGQDIPVHYLDDRHFDIHPLGECISGLIEGHHRHDFFEILWFTSSQAECHYIDFKPYPVKAGLFYFMVPGQVHAFTGRNPEGYVLVFSRDFFSEIMDDRFRMLFNPFMNEGLEAGGETSQVLKGIVRLMMTENAGSRELHILQAYMKAFLFQLSRLCSEIGFSLDRSGKRMRDLFDLLERGFRAERQAGYYANRLGLTPKRLNEILKQRFGSTLTQLLHNRLVLEAKREIAYGRKNMKEIAFELGFSDQAYFSRFFKVQTGMTPESFRHKMLEAA